jgi:hypothetical protein
MSKWFGHTVRVDKEELLPLHDYKGAVDYIIVSFRTKDDGFLDVGNRKKQTFPWVKVMNRTDLKSVFPHSNIERLAIASD